MRKISMDQKSNHNLSENDINLEDVDGIGGRKIYGK